MKKEYAAPTAEILQFKFADIIVTSRFPDTVFDYDPWYTPRADTPGTYYFGKDVWDDENDDAPSTGYSGNSWDDHASHTPGTGHFGNVWDDDSDIPGTTHAAGGWDDSP